MRYLSLILVLFLLLGNAQAQVGWKQSSGPEGGNVRTVAASLDGKTVLAGFWNGALYRTTASAAAWTPLASIEGLQSLSAQGDILFAQSYSGLFQSYDFGGSWVPVVRGSSSTLFSPIVRGRDGLYFIANDSIYRSTDAGDNWNFSGTTGQGALEIGYSGKKATESALIVAGSGTGVFASSDRGISWVRAEKGLPVNPVLSSMATIANGGEYSVWVCVQGQGVYYTDNGGKDWDKECDGLPEYGSGYPNFTKLVEANGKLFGVTDHAVYEYSFVDEIWKKANHLLGKNIQAYGGRMYSSGADGVELSNDGGMNWQKVGADLRFITVGDFASARKAVLAAAQNGIFRTLDHGLTWTKTGDFYAEDLRAGHGVAYATSLEGVRRSTDDGLTWDLANTGISQELYHLSTVSANPAAAFAGFYDVFGDHGVSRWNSGGVFRSTDNGLNWIAVNTGLASKDGVPVPVIKLEAFSDVQLALTLDGLYASTNNGDSWSKASIAFDLANDRLIDVARYHDTIFVASMRSMYRSTDAGQNWTTFASGLQTNLENHQALLQLQDTLILKSYDMMGQLVTYRLEGVTWLNFRMSAPAGVEFTRFFAEGATLYAGSNGHSVWTRSIPLQAGVANDITHELAMSVYPNPFATVSTISFTLPRPMQVSAGLYDARGLQVIDLGSRSLPQGFHTLLIPAASLAAGSYICRLVTEDGAAQEQVVLLK